ncbi:MAG TPA: hypothetical protein VHF88_05825, partial [Thermoleophilaceae bacterium]|nr:hypothetical protein [Thermoleophilaceae bacterium]
AQLLAQYQARLEQLVAAWDPTAQTTSPDFVDRRDLGTIGRYVNAYKAAGGGWGDRVAFHPYWGAHAETTATTLDLIGLAPAGASVWITEVGAFARDQGSIEADETTQNDKVWWLAENLGTLPQVERIHYYHMRGNPNASWDTGLMDVDASPRIAWHTWCAMSRGFTHPDCQPVTSRTAPPPPPPPPPSPDPPAPDPPPSTPAPSPGASQTPPSAPAPVLPPGTSPRPAAPTATTPLRAPAGDRTPPALTIERLARRLTYAEFVDGIAVKVRSNEPTTLVVTITVQGARRRDGRRRHAVVARKRVSAARVVRVVRLEPRKRRLGERRGFVARIEVRATDLAGNGNRAISRVRVRRTG